MILREPKLDDWEWIYEAYKDWPWGDEGPWSPDKAQRLTRRWVLRKHPKCLVYEGGNPVGLVTYYQVWMQVWVDNLVIHPKFRGQGFSTRLLRDFKKKLAEEGVVVARFKTLPGIIREHLGSRYTDLGNGEGQMTWDMRL